MAENDLKVILKAEECNKCMKCMKEWLEKRSDTP